ncbi:MAG: GDP-mannose 4,6-dehydratase [Chloroflexi bacterium]|nr:GDP-mannose 4,6-dehydratase [Chloroflexota bacterium]
MTWLITGGCGFVGSNLADTILARGEDVVILDNLSRVGSRANLDWLRSRHGDGWLFVQADVRNHDAVLDLVTQTKPYAIAHLAGQVAMTTSLQNPRLDFEINVMGTLNVLEAVRMTSPDTIVLYSSTNKVYGDLEWISYEESLTRYVATNYPKGFDETLPLSFCSPYGCSKGAADQYMLDYARMYGVQTVVFRHSSMYGGRQFATYDQGWIGWFCEKALETKHALDTGQPVSSFTISGNGKQVRDVLHSDDISRLYLISAANINQTHGQAFNIGGGMDHSLSLLELFTLLEELLDIQLLYKNIEWRHSDQKVFVADISKAGQFGWFPEIDLRNGIQAMIDWQSGISDV